VPGDGCTAQCGFDYEPQRPTTAGQLYVTELLARPTSGGEWFEILNDHSWPLDLQGCQLTDGGAQSWFVDGPLVVEPGSWLVFAAAADPAGDGSVAVDHVYDPARFSLAAVDRVRLVCGGVLIDRVRLDGAGFPLVPGAAAALDPQAFSGTANDAPGNWCAATATYGTGGQRGTPGALNDDCGLTAICGDGAEEPGEECDDGAFNSPTARDACRGDCRLPACGDGVVDSGEGCDDENLADGDGCSAQCVREPVCGDGALDLGEGCDDGPANSDVRPDACRSDCRPARCGDGVVDAGEDCDDGARVAGDGCSPLCEFDAAPEPARVPGQVVFSEILADPAVLPDEVGEWIELTSGDLGVYDLDGCVVSAGGGDSVTITGPGALLVGPGQYRVLAPSADPAGDGSVTPALVYPWTSLSLANAGDTLALTCGGVVIDRVTWTPDAWPVATGASLALDPSALTAGANDRPGAWCAGAAPYGVGANRGTPGRPNPSCGHAAICGNDRLEPGEGCDDGDANSDVLPDACRWDCQPARCGDRVIDGAEDCDDGGTVAGDGCGATCLAEGTCGNGELEPGEACDDGPLNSDTLPDRCRRDCRAARCGDRVVDTGETCDDGDALGGDGCSAACTWEPLAAPTTAGALVFSEVMVDPVGADDAVGEWFELWNASDRIFDLQGCRIDSAGEAGFDLFGPLVVYGGAALVFAASGDPAGNGDVLPDYVFGRAEAALASTADGLTLRCGAVVIDALAWDPALDWPLAPGRSLSLDPRSLDADANDLPASWCEGSAPYGPAGADAGTPGAPNPFCP
jgi:cysteine-rich repeat protein